MSLPVLFNIVEMPQFSPKIHVTNKASFNEVTLLNVVSLIVNTCI